MGLKKLNEFFSGLLSILVGERRQLQLLLNLASHDITSLLLFFNQCTLYCGLHIVLKDIL